MRPIPRAKPVHRGTIGRPSVPEVRPEPATRPSLPAWFVWLVGIALSLQIPVLFQMRDVGHLGGFFIVLRGALEQLIFWTNSHLQQMIFMNLAAIAWLMVWRTRWPGVLSAAGVLPLAATSGIVLINLIVWVVTLFLVLVTSWAILKALLEE